MNMDFDLVRSFGKRAGRFREEKYAFIQCVNEWKKDRENGSSVYFWHCGSFSHRSSVKYEHFIYFFGVKRECVYTLAFNFISDIIFTRRVRWLLWVWMVCGCWTSERKNFDEKQHEKETTSKTKKQIPTLTLQKKTNAPATATAIAKQRSFV